MDLRLSPVEARLLGCLVEKEATTPDLYPLSLNALRLACNQKSNREPVMDLSEEVVGDALDHLRQIRLVWRHQGAGERVEKYLHGLDRMFDFSRPQIAVLGLLFLRGPQTAAELRQRTVRMHPFASTAEIEDVLESLAALPDGPFVVKLPRQPGTREPRWSHLFCGEPAVAPPPAPRPSEPGTRVARVTGPAEPPAPDRLRNLERQIEELRRRVEVLETGRVREDDPPPAD